MSCTHPTDEILRPTTSMQWCKACGAIRNGETDGWRTPQVVPKDAASMSTLSGRHINLLSPRPEDVVLEEMAHQLAMQARFNGAIKMFYGLAEHSVNVALSMYALLGGGGGRSGDGRTSQYTLIRPLILPPEADPRMFWGAILRALVHDGAEATLGDVIRPLKQLLPTYQKLEELHMRAIHTAFGFGADEEWATLDAVIHRMDYATFALEDHVLRGAPMPQAPLPGVRVLGWEWRSAKGIFLALAHELMAKFAPHREHLPLEIVAS